MNRLMLLSAPVVLACLMVAPAARSVPTTQPTPEAESHRIKEELARVQGKLEESHKEIERLQEQLREMRRPAVVTPAPFQPRWPSLRVIPPTQKTPEGWILRNPNSNVWHYVVPAGSQF